MSETKTPWTPGPLRLLQPSQVALDDLMSLEQRTWAVFADSYGSKVHHIALQVKEQNAHLISAAPELYEALAEALTWESDAKPRTHGGWAKTARAALAKARGEGEQ